MEMRENLLDFNKICRLCLTEETVMSSIYSDNEPQSNSVPLPLRIMACVSIEVSSNDGLPSQICGTCLCQVDGWYKFKDLCENTDNILRRYISNEPVQIEGISQIQSMAQEVKKYFTTQVKEEHDGDIQRKTPESKKKMRTVENNEDGNRLYSLLTYGSRSTTSDIKEEDYEGLASADVVALPLAIKAEDSSDNSLDNQTLASRIKTRRGGCHENDLDNGFSSDDSLTLFHTQKKLILRSKLKSRSKSWMKREEARQARTIQTQTGSDDEDDDDDDCLPDVMDAALDEDEEDEDDDMEDDDEDDKERQRKKIKSRKTQTPKEKGQKKRFRIRPAVPSACTLCDKVYKNSEILRQHMKSHHVTGTIECGHCKMTFTSLRSLKYHEQRKHSNLEPVPCTFCGKEFLDKKYLRIHENIHSQANQYVCQFCGRKFIMKTNLTVHISRHHTLKTNDFICQVCGKAFPFKLYLKKHFKTHTDYKPHECNFCDAKFREPTLLRKHINSIHLKLRPFLCQVCHKTFTRSLYLREHMESQHLGIQKKIECPRCGENFQNRNRLRQHECEGRLEIL